MGGRGHRGAGPARRRDGEVFDPRYYRWRMIPPLPAAFGEVSELTICPAGPSLLVAATVTPDEIGGKRYVAALQLSTTLRCDNARCPPVPELREWRDHVAQAAAEERWVTLGSLPYGGEYPSAGWYGSLLCVARQ